MNYRVVWRDRYYHASAPVASLEAAEAFVWMLRGTAYTASIQSYAGDGVWCELGVACEDHVHEEHGPRYEVAGRFVACSIRDAIDARRAGPASR